MIVQLYTDGSFHMDAGRGAWALHAIGMVAGKERVIERYGPCPAYVVTPTHAELAAILAAVVTVKARFPGLGGAQLYTDSRDAVELLVGKRRPADVEGPLVQKIRAERLRIEPTWIPAHQHGSTSVHAPKNNRVDLLARRAMAEVLFAMGAKFPRRHDVIRAMSAPELVELHSEVRAALNKRFGGNSRGLNASRVWAWEFLGLTSGSRARRVHFLTREQAEALLMELGKE